MNVELHPAAQREIDDAQRWYEERSTLAASAFLRELSIAIQRIRQTPERYPAADAARAEFFSSDSHSRFTIV
jgi:plasmid stabilization system protein ParE